MSVVEVRLNLVEQEISETLQVLWAFFFALLVAMWCTKDPRRHEFEPPFEFAAFVYFFWPLVLPYYLYTTRGIEGIVTFIGFIGIYSAPFLLGLIAYVYYAP